MSSTTTNPYPEVPLPAGIGRVSEWDSDGYRDLFGLDHTVTNQAVRIHSLGSQATDGSISLGCVVVLADGENEAFSLLGDEARELASALQSLRASADIPTARLQLVGMAAVGELVQSTSGQWMVRPPQRCAQGHRLRPGHMLLGTIACSCGRHLTWRCECGAASYGPALAEGCSVLDGPARVRG